MLLLVVCDNLAKGTFLLVYVSQSQESCPDYSKTELLLFLMEFLRNFDLPCKLLVLFSFLVSLLVSFGGIVRMVHKSIHTQTYTLQTKILFL